MTTRLAPMINQEYVRCDLCGYDETFPVARGSRHDIAVSISVCTRCGFVFQNPRMTQESLNSFYQREYRRLYSGSETEPAESLLRQQDRRGRTMLRSCSPWLHSNATVVDVGCGPGATLKAFHEAGHRVVGIEPGLYGAWGRQHLGLDIRDSTLSDLLLKDFRADLVILAFVLEHVWSPRQLLDEARQLVGDGGLLFVEVPNLRAARGDSRAYFHLAHLSYFTAATLRSFLELSSFRVVRLDAGGGYSIQAIALADSPRISTDRSEPADDPNEIRRTIRRFVVLSTIEAWIKGVFILGLRGIAALADRVAGEGSGARLITRVQELWRRIRYGCQDE